MILEAYLVAQVFLFVMLVGAYNKKDEILWGMSAVYAGIMAMMSSRIDIFAASSGTFFQHGDQTMFVLDFAIMFIATVWMFLDTWSNHGSPLLLFARFKKGKVPIVSPIVQNGQHAANQLFHGGKKTEPPVQ
jgi:hypothetical protein